MNLIKPEKLKKGDLLSIIAPCGIVDEGSINNGIKYFEDKGFRVKLGRHIFDKYYYMAGSDEHRASDLNEAFEDDEVSAIICARGGYGALRIIDKINYDIIKSNPKIFCGYSDVSLLSAMILKKTGLITYSGPMVRGDFQCGQINSYTEEAFYSALYQNLTEITPLNKKVYCSGDCEGITFGGNLATIASLCGIDFVPDKRFIFFAEDLNEPVYKIDKYFNQLLNISKFCANLSGIILGDFLDIEDYSVLDNFFFELGKRLKIPIYGGFPISHSKLKATIPYGHMAKLMSGKLIFSI